MQRLPSCICTLFSDSQQGTVTGLQSKGASQGASQGAGHLAMMSGMASLMLAGRALRFLGRPVSPGGNDMDSPWSSTLLALPMVAFMPTLASPKPVLAMALTQFCIKQAAEQSHMCSGASCAVC